MKRSDLEHILRASKDVTGENEFIVIGSQSAWSGRLTTEFLIKLSGHNRPEESPLLPGIAVIELHIVQPARRSLNVHGDLVAGADLDVGDGVVRPALSLAR